MHAQVPIYSRGVITITNIELSILITWWVNFIKSSNKRKFSTDKLFFWEVLGFSYLAAHQTIIITYYWVQARQSTK